MKRMFSWVMLSKQFDYMEGYISRQKTLGGELRDKGMSVEQELIMKYNLLSSMAKYILVQSLQRKNVHSSEVSLNVIYLESYSESSQLYRL
jgi:hypothetical protein